MTMKTLKLRTALLLLPVGGMFAVAFLISWLGSMGAASAQALQASPTPLASTDTSQFVDLLMSGKYAAAVGIALVVVVGMARAGLSKLVPWFGTTLGGTVLAYATSVAGYIGTALASGTPVDARLILLALVTALAAVGGWEHVKDIVSALRTAPATVAKAATTGVVAVLLVASCAESPRVVAANIVTAELDCTAPALIGLVRSTGSAMETYVAGKIADDGRSVDTAEMRTDLRAVASKAWSCAVTQALAALLGQPMANVSLSHAAGPRLVTDPAALRAAIAALKEELHVTSVKLPDGTSI